VVGRLSLARRWLSWAIRSCKTLWAVITPRRVTERGLRDARLRRGFRKTASFAGGEKADEIIQASAVGFIASGHKSMPIFGTSSAPGLLLPGYLKETQRKECLNETL
jgi:hypothetical protein